MAPEERTTAILTHGSLFAGIGGFDLGFERAGIKTVWQDEADRLRNGIGDVRGQWTAEPDVGRVAHGIPARVDRLKGLGNAVVPQIAEWIGRRIVEAAEKER